MDSDQGKLFIGGISWETTEDKLREYFGKYGEVMQAVIMRDKISGRPRGFGFIVFADPTLVDRVLQDKHTIDGRVVEAKRAMSREEQNMSSRSGNPTSGRSMGGSGGGGGQKTKKIFVGGLPPTLSEEGFRKYFEAYGTVTDVVVMYDQNTQRPRGFGFISFDSEDAVDRVLHKTFHDLGGKLVEVKRAMPKDALSHGSGGGRPMGGGGGGYQQYGGPIPGSGGYEGRMDGNRYMPPQSGGGFPPYGSSGYGAHSYGYGAGSNGVGYGGYGVGGYGGPAGGYGNPSAPAGGYPSGPRSPWSSQQQAGYGSGYGGNAGYGSGSGQSPSGSGGYGNQGYGYGGYGGGGEYISRGGGSGGGGGGGDQHGPGSGYMGGGYGDAGGGYPSSWKSDPSQGAGYGPGQSGYGSYGGGPARQAQQQ